MKNTEEKMNLARRQELERQIKILSDKLAFCRFQDEKDFIQAKIDPLATELASIPKVTPKKAEPKKVQAVASPKPEMTKEQEEEYLKSLRDKSVKRKAYKGKD